VRHDRYRATPSCCIRKRGEACDRILRAGPVAGLAAANAYFSRGWMRFNANEVDLAISDFTEALKVQPDNYWSLNNRGALCASKNDLTRALSDFNEAIHINPKFAIAYANRADVLRHQGKLGEAMADVRTALEIDGKLTRALMVRDAIQADLARGAQPTGPKGQAPSNPQGFTPRSRPNTYSEQGLRQRHRRSHGPDPQRQQQLARLCAPCLAYHRKSQPDSALEDYNRAISQNGHEASTHYNRALIYAQKGNLDTALSDLDAAIDQHGGMDTEFLFERGRIHTRKSMHAQAVADYSKAIDVLSKDKTAHE
jgi:tetratricopeptide (TPR) repeat protein